MDMASGTIKKVISDRGFGFIAGEDGKEYFFHRDGLGAALNFEALRGGERVEFDLQSNPRGPRAVNVRPA
jgi:CspA family cold shock protein